MEKKLCLGKSPKAILDYLQSAADEIIEKEYYTPLSADEVVISRKQFIDNAIALSSLAEQKKEVIAEFKNQMKPMSDENIQLAKELGTGLHRLKGKLYKFVDATARKTYFYDVDGEQLENETRPSSKEELRQMSIVREIRTEGTND